MHQECQGLKKRSLRRRLQHLPSPLSRCQLRFTKRAAASTVSNRYFVSESEMKTNSPERNHGSANSFLRLAVIIIFPLLFSVQSSIQKYFVSFGVLIRVTQVCKPFRPTVLCFYAAAWRVVEAFKPLLENFRLHAVCDVNREHTFLEIKKIIIL